MAKLKSLTLSNFLLFSLLIQSIEAVQFLSITCLSFLSVSDDAMPNPSATTVLVP